MAKKKKERKENATYELKPAKFKTTTKRILALDPGSTNMGISLIAVSEDLRVKVIANSIITKPLHDLVRVNGGRSEFLAEIARWVSYYDPQAIAAERFQTRGIKGKTVEAVSIMLGLLGGKYEHLPLMLVTAGTWKNAFHRRFDVELDDLYKLTLTTPHQLDSILLGLYCMEKGMQVELDYDPFDIVQQAENTSAVRLINKRR
jgi:hypothetical protein